MSKRKEPGTVRRTYEYIKSNQQEHDIRLMCRLLNVAPSGYYAWLKEPVSNRALEDARLLRLIRASFTASHGIYGAPRVFLDLREAGETCSKHRVARLMRVNGDCQVFCVRATSTQPRIVSACSATRDTR